jgi:hypothetical protein
LLIKYENLKKEFYDQGEQLKLTFEARYYKRLNAIIKRDPYNTMASQSKMIERNAKI